MDKDPIQLTNNELGCPDCKIELIPDKIPYHWKRKLLGYFDGIKCTKCNYSLLTEKGFCDSGNVIKYGTQKDNNGLVSFPEFNKTEFKSSGINNTNLPKVIFVDYI